MPPGQSGVASRRPGSRAPGCGARAGRRRSSRRCRSRRASAVSVLSPSRTCRSDAYQSLQPSPIAPECALLRAPVPSALVTRRLERPCVYSCQTTPESSPPLMLRKSRAAASWSPGTGTSASSAAARRAASTCWRCCGGWRPGRRARLTPSSVWVSTASPPAFSKLPQALVKPMRGGLEVVVEAGDEVEGLHAVLEAVDRPGVEARGRVGRVPRAGLRRPCRPRSRPGCRA